MVPILHHNDTGSVHVKNLNRGQKRNLLFTSLTINDWFKTDWRGNDNIRSIKVWEINNFFLFRKNFDTHSEEIIFVILVFFNLLLVFNHPLIRASSFLFLSFRLNWDLLSFDFFLIFHEFLLNLFEDRFSITNIWSDDKIFSIGETFCFFFFLKGLNTTFLMLIHVRNNYFSKLLNCLFFIIFNMNVINVTVDDFLWSLIFINLFILLFLSLLLHWRGGGFC